MRKCANALKARQDSARGAGVPFLPALWFFIVGLFLLALPGVLGAVEKDFNVQGVTLRLEETTSEVLPRFQAMRFNRALGVWNVDVTLTNRGTRMLRTPFLLTMNCGVDTLRAVAPDGYDGGDTNVPLFDLSGYAAGGTLAPGAVTPKRTLSLSGTGAAPQLGGRVYSRPPSAPFALAVAQVLDAAGQPLPAVVALETGPLGARSVTNDADSALATLGQTAGQHVWRFEKAGYLPVWRCSDLATGVSGELASPRLTPRSALGATLTAAAGGRLQAPERGLLVTFPAAAFAQDTTAVLTPLDAQSLPAPLPPGWSPLQAFWLELDAEPGSAGTGVLALWDALLPGETAALARWNPSSLQWEVAALAAGNGSSVLTVALAGGGAYAVVVGDGDPALAPPAAQQGQPLAASGAAFPAGAELTASGRVEPEVAMASAVPERVTAQAFVVITNAAGAVPSGLALQADVTESYRLQDGTRRRTPPYATTLTGYQRPGDGVANTLHAQVGLRPQLLFGSTTLAEAIVTFDVRSPSAFAASVFETDGGRVESQGVALLAGVGDVAGPQTVELSVLSPLDFIDVAAGATVLTAFEVRVGGVAAGRHLVARVSAAQTNGFFVLARALSEGSFSGLEPLERLTRLASGVLVSSEPAAEPRLPGITRAGKYVVLALAAPQALVSGVVRNRLGTLAAGIALQVAGQPWLTFSGAGGQYRLLAPEGAGLLMSTEGATGDQGFADVSVGPDFEAVVADIETGLAGPRVLTVVPANGAAAVPRVSSVMITFSEALDPATLGTNGVRVVDTNGLALAATLRLNLCGTVATLLPAARLAPAMRYTVCVTNAIADPGGQVLAGPREFVFTTARDALDRVGAQVISYEPTNGLARLVGSPGTADPEAPVILVNETSGSTATVLSRPDGSFDNTIEADVDDFLSAVVVNENGTRNIIPVSRQLFRDGSVGLFNGGGILEAESDGGPVQVIIDPGSIPSKTKFKMVSFPIWELMQLMSNAPPVAAQGLGGFRIELSGDPVTAPPHVSLPVDPALFDLPPGVEATNAVIVLARPREVQGVTVYEVVDEMVYNDGRVSTHSWGFSLQDAKDYLSIAYRGVMGGVVVSGRVVCNTAGGEKPVPGATVMVVDQNADMNVHGRVSRGAMVAMSNENGAYKLKVPLPLGQNAVDGLASSLYFPGQYGIGNAYITEDATQVALKLVFSPRTAAALADIVPPTISMLATPSLPMVSQTVEVLVRGTDNATAPSLTLDIAQTDPTDLTSADVTVTPPVAAETLAQTTKARYRVSASRSGRVVLRATATDGSGLPPSTAQYVLLFTDEPRPAPVVTGTDRDPPYVVWTLPRHQGSAEDAFQPIKILFNEPIRSSALSQLQNAVQIVATSGSTSSTLTGALTGQLSADGRELTLYAKLEPNTAYSITLNAEFKDLAGNGLFQYPDDATHEYTFSFSTRALVVKRLGEVTHGKGVVSDPQGTFYYVLDRGIDWLSASLRVYGTNATGVALRHYGSCHVSNYPQDLVYIGPYDYQEINGRRRHGVLVGVAGGLVGDVAPWLAVVDVANPSNPEVLARAPVNYAQGTGVSRLQWSAPSLAYLQIGSDGIGATSIGLVNLQLFLYAHRTLDGGYSGYNPFASEVASPGKDLNGDGDYVDAGEEIPHLNGRRLVAGVENGGLVAAFSIPPDPNGDYGTEVIKDFALAQGGRFVAVVHGPGRGNDPPGYRTLAADGVPLGAFQGAVSFPQTPSRLAVFQGVPVSGDTNGLRQINLAVVTGGKGERILTFLDVTDPRNPVELKDLTIPNEWGKPWSVQMALDGRLMVGTSATSFQSSPGLALIDPRLLLHPSQIGVHPALVSIVRGAGNSSYSFVGLGSDRFAVAQGGFAVASVPVAFPTTFEARSIVVADANDNPRRLSEDALLELVTDRNTTNNTGVSGVSHILACEATPPPNLVVPYGQPTWRVSDYDSQDVGLIAHLAMPDYDMGLLDAANPFLFLCTPDEHRVQCGRHEVIVNVYPDIENGLQLNSTNLAKSIELITNGVAAIRSAMAVIPGGYCEFTFQRATAGVINFKNQWQECPTNNLATWTWKLNGQIDPLVAITGRAGYRVQVPTIPALGPIGFDLFMQLSGEMSLAGGLEKNKEGQISGPQVRLGGVLAFTGGAQANLTSLCSASLVLDSRIEGEGVLSLGRDPNTQGMHVYLDQTVKWTGLQVRGSVRLSNAWLVNLNQSAEVGVAWVLVDPMEIVPPERLEVY